MLEIKLVVIFQCIVVIVFVLVSVFFFGSSQVWCAARRPVWFLLLLDHA